MNNRRKYNKMKKIMNYTDYIMEITEKLYMYTNNKIMPIFINLKLKYNPKYSNKEFLINLTIYDEDGDIWEDKYYNVQNEKDFKNISQELINRMKDVEYNYIYKDDENIFPLFEEIGL